MSLPGPRLRTALPASLCVVVGVSAALSRRWVADDAYISFRYARNLIEGQGLVYNAGERVEGYTNFLWTLWCALGMGVGVGPERWSAIWGAAAYGGTLALLARGAAQLGVRERRVPLAALLGALLIPMWDHAANGLETALFSLLVLAALLQQLGASSPGRRLLTGLLFGAASLTRPEGALFFGVSMAFSALIARPPALRALLPTALGFAALVLPQLVFRFVYYGELLPNTYYAKSAQLAWYAQGLRYGAATLTQHWVLLLACAAPLLLRRAGRPLLPAVQLLGCAGVYAFYLVRVGGDFMLHRMWVPVIPLLLLSLELGLDALVPPGLVARAALAAVLLAPVYLGPAPDPQGLWEAGIVDERSFPDPLRAQPDRARVLAELLEGLPVRVAFTGGDARLMYLARIPLAIEAETGLTDRTLARQPLSQRGRVGHEKPAPLDYLLRRGVHFTFRLRGLHILKVAERLPLLEVRKAGVRMFVLHRDEALLAELQRRGARMRGAGRSP